jgi:hypothetical protein
MCPVSSFKSLFWLIYRLCGEHPHKRAPPEESQVARNAPCSAPPRLATLRVGPIYTERIRYSSCWARIERYPKSTARGPVLANHGSRPTAPAPSSIGQSQRLLRAWSHSPRCIQVLPCHRCTPRDVFGPDEIATTTICDHWQRPWCDTWFRKLASVAHLWPSIRPFCVMEAAGISSVLVIRRRTAVRWIRQWRRLRPRKRVGTRRTRRRIRGWRCGRRP